MDKSGKSHPLALKITALGAESLDCADMIPFGPEEGLDYASLPPRFVKFITFLEQNKLAYAKDDLAKRLAKEQPQHHALYLQQGVDLDQLMFDAGFFTVHEHKCWNSVYSLENGEPVKGKGADGKDVPVELCMNATDYGFEVRPLGGESENLGIADMPEGFRKVADTMEKMHDAALTQQKQSVGSLVGTEKPRTFEKTN